MPIKHSKRFDYDESRMKPGREAVLDRIRQISLALPESSETITFGNPAFQIAQKTYCVLEEYKGELSLAVKVGRERQARLLKDSRFYRTPYVGRFGWVSLRIHAAPVDWTEVQALIEDSYRLIAPRRFADQVARG
jgi:predicted DNA-binding protein (MmcQ/YjbR family)